jgi:hypothetical protein
MRTIQEILQTEYVPEELDLGDENGWTETMYKKYDELLQWCRDGSKSSKDLSSCYTEYSFIADDATHTVKVISRVDSGD